MKHHLLWLGHVGSQYALQQQEEKIEKTLISEYYGDYAMMMSLIAVDGDVVTPDQPRHEKIKMMIIMDVQVHHHHHGMKQCSPLLKRQTDNHWSVES